jgi:hypothetical protein
MLRSIRRVSGLLWLILAVFISACETPPENLVTVPMSDSTSPTVGGLISFSDPNKGNVDLLSDPIARKVNSGEKITFLASGTDNDGGAKDIQIWANFTYYKDGQQTGPTIPQSPLVSNPSTAIVGEKTLKQRIASYTFDIAQIRKNYTGLSIKTWTIAKNFYGGEIRSPTVTLEWP